MYFKIVYMQENPFFKGNLVLSTGELATVKRFESFRNSLRWPIHIINPVDKTKLP